MRRPALGRPPRRAQPTRRYDALMRWVGLALGCYLLVAALARLAEVAGLQRCDCAEDCWCKRPALSTFRWVFPIGHRTRPA